MHSLTRFLDRYSAFLAGLACLLIVLVLAWSLAEASLTLYEEVYKGRHTAAEASVTVDTRETADGSITISRISLFGRPPPETPEAETVAAPETGLDLALKGVFVATDPGRSTAIISAGDEHGGIYYPGDLLPGNAVLTAVQEEQVLLTRRGKLEALKFAEEEETEKKAPKAQNRPGGRRNGSG